MKTLPFHLMSWLGALFLAAVVHGQRAIAEEPYAEIKSVLLQGTNVVVEVEASTDFSKITLESSTRVGRRAWEPRAVHHLEPADSGLATFTFTVPLSPALEILRVRGDITTALPAAFFDGPTNFVSGSGNGAGGPSAGGPLENGDVRAPADGDFAGGGDRTVVESDIWKLHDDTLYFFNQYRGLQIIDVSDPDAPTVTGAYDLAAAGEQMYLIDGHKVVLLARDTCSWYGDSSESRVVLLDAATDEPELVAQLPVKGYIVESRLVGSALYVVANSYQQRPAPAETDATGSLIWEWGTEIYSFDLADFHAPVARSSDWVAGYNNVILATDRFLLVAQSGYQMNDGYASTIHIYDISNPDGTFEQLSTTRALGIIRDKFKMNISGDVLAVVSQRESVAGRPTMVETISLEDPRSPQRLGSLKIIENEQLHATRFHGDLLYAVTFMQVDPLWIIDLSDPTAPEIKGELEIPGWSTYIHPLPGQLLTIGIDNTAGWRTSVQLFDVSDVSNPTLASKVLIGDSSSGSEANQDEKAFQVLPEENLILVPFHGNVGDQNWINGVQIIDFLPGELVKRGVIEQEFQPRRATLHRERILSLSARELLTVDASDRDHPEIINSTELSWATDQLHLVGDYLLQIDRYSSGNPSVRVVPAAQLSTQLNKLTLTNLPFLGSTVANDKLYVLQGRSRELVYPEIWTPTNYAPVKTNAGVLAITVYDLSALPEISLLSQTTEPNESEHFYGQFEAVWVQDALIVWVNTQNYGGPWYYDGPISIAAADATAGAFASPDAIGMPYYFWYGGSTGQFIAVDVAAESPAITSILRLSGTNGWWNFSDSYTANGLLYTSHMATEFDPEFDPPPQVYGSWDGSKIVTLTNDPPKGAYVQRQYLDVIDYSDPEDPLLRKPVNIPGSLIGIHRQGELLFTRGYDLSQGYWQGGDETISASAYDGTQASLIDSLNLEQSWPKPALAQNGQIYLGRPATTNQSPALEVWNLSPDGKFSLANSVDLSTPASQLAFYDGLLAVQTSQIELYDASSPPALVHIGAADTRACYGVALDNGAGSVQRGLWLPLGWYGVIHIPAGQPAPEDGE